MPANRERPHSVVFDGFSSQEELLGCLLLYAPTLGQDISLISKSIPLGSDRTLDLLGVDRVGRPVAILATIEGGEASLVKVLDLAAWLEDAEALLERLLPGAQGNGHAGARLLFLAPGFSPGLLRLIDLLRRLRVELIQYRRLAVGNESAILFENLSTGEVSTAQREVVASTRLAGAAPTDSPLTQPELEELSRPLGSFGV